MEFLACRQSAQEVPQTVRWLCEPIILSIKHFQGYIKVQLNRWLKTAIL